MFPIYRFDYIVLAINNLALRMNSITPVYLLSFFACNNGANVQDTSLEEADSKTDTNGQNTNEDSYTITTNIVGNGVISPVVYQDVQQAEVRQFALMASEGFELTTVGGTCGGTMASYFLSVSVFQF